MVAFSRAYSALQWIHICTIAVPAIGAVGGETLELLEIAASSVELGAKATFMLF